MNALRAFDAVARHGSIWKAAQELHLTRSAISHQLRFLERDLGVALTERDGKRIELTHFGRLYAQEVRKALTTIARAADAADGVQLQGRFCISCTPGFATFWLCNHLGEFHNNYPLVRTKVVTQRRLDDVSDREADIFIAFGTGNWPNHWSELLAEVEFTPFCSPTLLSARGGLNSPADVARFPLLHLQSYADWTRWLSAAGVSQPDPERGIVFSDMYLVQSAAIAGQGIAMGDDMVCGGALAQGLLVRPFGLTIKAPGAYYLVTEHHKFDHPIGRAFREWLKARLGAERTPRA